MPTRNKGGARAHRLKRPGFAPESREVTEGYRATVSNDPQNREQRRHLMKGAVQQKPAGLVVKVDREAVSRAAQMLPRSP